MEPVRLIMYQPCYLTLQLLQGETLLEPILVSNALLGCLSKLAPRRTCPIGELWGEKAMLTLALSSVGRI
jgi:hypothetical protein